MTAKICARLAALILAIVAVLQLARAASGLPVGTTTSIRLWASWIACFVAMGPPGSVLMHLETETTPRQFLTVIFCGCSSLRLR
jgi:hypothetical protein